MRVSIDKMLTELWVRQKENVRHDLVWQILLLENKGYDMRHYYEELAAYDQYKT